MGARAGRPLAELCSEPRDGGPSRFRVLLRGRLTAGPDEESCAGAARGPLRVLSSRLLRCARLRAGKAIDYTCLVKADAAMALVVEYIFAADFERGTFEGWDETVGE